MKIPLFRAGRLAAVLFSLLLAACVTSHIDWNSRIGHYNFDQAVIELGPPDKQARLTDGTVVAEWMTSRGRTIRGGPYFSHGFRHREAFFEYDESTFPDQFLRLSFAPDGQLSAWKPVTK